MGGSAADPADVERRVADALDGLEHLVAVVAAIFVDGHGFSERRRGECSEETRAVSARLASQRRGGWRRFPVTGRLLVGVRDAEERPLAEGVPQELQSAGKP